jgi:hypothetical protein
VKNLSGTKFKLILFNNISSGGKIMKITCRKKKRRYKNELFNRRMFVNIRINQKNGVSQRNTLCEIKQNENTENGLSSSEEKCTRFWKLPADILIFLTNSSFRLFGTSSNAMAAGSLNAVLPMAITFKHIMKSSARVFPEVGL